MGAREISIGQCALAALLSVLILLSMNPFFLWSGGDESIKLGFLLVSCVIFLFFGRYENYTLTHSLLVALIFIIYCLYIFIPFREYDQVSFGFISFTPFLLMLFLSDAIKNNVRIYFCNIMIYISGLSLLSLFLYILKFPFPDITVEQSFRHSEYNHYVLYYFNVILNTQIFHLPLSVDFYRVSGIFAEPGHFGIYLCLALSLLRKPFSSKGGYILTLGIISTLSFSSYICLAVIYLFFGKRKLLAISILIFLTILSMLFITADGNELLNKFFLEKVSGKSIFEIMASRSNFDSAQFTFSSLDYLFGLGRAYLTDNGIIMSDIRMPLYRFGVFYYLIFFLFILILFSGRKFNSNSPDLKCCLAIFLLILFHRAFMVDNLYMFSYLLLMKCKYD